MAKNNKQPNPPIPAVQDIRIDKISIFFRRPILKAVMKILSMESNMYRSFKSVKNINRLFTSIDLSKYRNSPELESYIWCINFMSKQWLEGVLDPGIIAEGAKRQPEYDNIKEEIITKSMEDPDIITAPEVKEVMRLVGDALQFGYVVSVRDQYISLLEDINIEEPGAFQTIVQRLFMISKSLLDIKHNTNLVANKITFSTSDMDSMREAVCQTITSLSAKSNLLKTGIKRWNTLLSPAYMNGRLYCYAGVPGAGKSLILLKSVLDIRKYNPGFVPKTPGMRPCVLYVTMENTFTESIERIWNMNFDDSITDHSVDEAVDMLCRELGINRIINDNVEAWELDASGNKVKKIKAELIQEPKPPRAPGPNSDSTEVSLLNDLALREEASKEPNIEIAVKYFPYRDISTDDLFTIIQDLRDDNLECCALVFDYIKRIRPATPQADNVKLELNRIINELKALSVIEDIPVITAHQLNRNAAATIDAAVRQGKGDATKLAGREHIGDAWEVVEACDFLAITNIEYRPGTDDKYLTLNVVKRRRIDASEPELAKYTYLAHPFSKNNGLRLIDDVPLGKVLSLQSLVTDVDAIGKEKTNAVPRLVSIDQHEFREEDDI